MAKKKARKKQNIPIGETKAERFVRVVSPRVNKAVKAIGVIGFCAGSTYDYTPEQVQQILTVLGNAVAGLKDRFELKPKSTESFKFVG